MILILVIGVLTILGMYYIFEHFMLGRMMKLTSNIPGPKRYPVLGSALEFGRNGVDFIANFKRIVYKFGPVTRVWIGPTLYVVLTDSKDIEMILSSTTHLDKSQIYGFLAKWLGMGLLTSSGTKWKIRRKILTPAFHFKILESYIDIFNSNLRILMKLLEKELGKEKFDISQYIDGCMLDIICESAMSTSINAQLNKESQFPKAIKEVSNAVVVRGHRPWLFPDFIFNLSSTGRAYNKQLEYINSFIDMVIHKKKESLAQSNVDLLKNSQSNEEGEEDNLTASKKRYTFLDLLLMYAADSSLQLSDTDIRDEVNTFMFGGYDTTASTIGFAIHLLGSHPDVQAKVVAELKSVFGDSDREPTYQDLMSLKYTEQVIKETLRLYPAVPYISRLLHEDVKLPSGYTVPAGAAVSCFFYVLHRNQEVFPEPEKFNPDNFLQESNTSRFAFSYTPFSAGPRNCIGQKFAMLEMKATLSRLLRTYRVTSVDPAPLLAAQLILRSETGINVRLDKI